MSVSPSILSRNTAFDVSSSPFLPPPFSSLLLFSSFFRIGSNDSGRIVVSISIRYSAFEYCSRLSFLLPPLFFFSSLFPFFLFFPSMHGKRWGNGQSSQMELPVSFLSPPFFPFFFFPPPFSLFPVYLSKDGIAARHRRFRNRRASVLLVFSSGLYPLRFSPPFPFLPS